MINKNCTIDEEGLQFLKNFPEIKEDELYTKIGVLLGKHYAKCVNVMTENRNNRIPETSQMHENPSHSSTISDIPT
jgi:hypothetical protein